MAATGHGWTWNFADGADAFVATVHAEDRARVAAILATREPTAFRAMVHGDDGVLRTFEIEVDVAGRARGRDVTREVDREVRLAFYSDVWSAVHIGLSAWRLVDTADGRRLRLIAFNPTFEQLANRSLSPQLGEILIEVFPAFDRPLVEAARALRPDSGILRAAPFRLRPEPDAPFVRASVFPLAGGHVGLSLEDVTERHRDDSIHATERRAFDMLGSAALPAILDEIVGGIEAISFATIGSILLVDPTGTKVVHGSAPNLPREFIDAIDGSSIGPAAGSCGTAAYRREPVYVEDIDRDPLWDDYRAIAQRHGLRSCWSSPIVGNDGRVLGTLALYHRQPRAPSEADKDLLARVAHVTRIVLERRLLDEQLRALAARLDATREDERTSIARDIHDQLGQALTALKLDVAWVGRRLTDPPLTAKLDEMGRATDEIIATVRRIASDLRPGILDDVGLAAAIEWQADEFARSTGVRCHVRSAMPVLDLDRELATTVFRIFQESLTNVARHANAREVDIALTLADGKLSLEVADDGIGLPDVGPRDTLGLLGMGERARRLGGECTVRRRSPTGTVVRLVIPLRLAAA